MHNFHSSRVPGVVRKGWWNTAICWIKRRRGRTFETETDLLLLLAINNNSSSVGSGSVKELILLGADE